MITGRFVSFSFGLFSVGFFFVILVLDNEISTFKTFCIMRVLMQHVLVLFVLNLFKIFTNAHYDMQNLFSKVDDDEFFMVPLILVVKHSFSLL